MWRNEEDAKLLAEAHRESCPVGRDCRKTCPEASPLYWGMAWRSQPMPPQAAHDVFPSRSKTAGSLSRFMKGVEKAANVLEEQRRVIDDAQEVLANFDGSPEDLPEFLAALEAVLKRQVGEA